MSRGEVTATAEANGDVAAGTGFRADTDAYVRTTCAELEGVRSVSEAVVVATRELADGERLPPLYEVVDPEALDGLYGATDGRSRGEDRPLGYVQFAYGPFSVTVRGGGDIHVRRRGER